MSYSLSLRKENFKFSSAHFTIFDKNNSEALHGHNYRVSVRLTTKSSSLKNEMVCDFNVIKSQVKAICDDLDEKILIPEKSPYLTVKPSDTFPHHTHVIYNRKNYIVPDEDVFRIVAENITSEALARFVAERLSRSVKNLFQHLTVSVEETRGQAASYSMSL